MNKRYRHNPESFMEYETHKRLWDLVKQTDHLISARPPDVVIVNNNNKKKEKKRKEKKKGNILNRHGRPQSKTESKRKEE